MRRAPLWLFALAVAAGSAHGDPPGPGVTPPSSPVPRCCGASCSSSTDACLQGDPLHVTSKTLFHRVQVAAVGASPSDLELNLTYSSSTDTWYEFNGNAVELGLLRRMHKPFGGDLGGSVFSSKPPRGHSLHWTHNWFAFVANESNLQGSYRTDFPSYLMVRDASGAHHELGGWASGLFSSTSGGPPDCVPATSGVPAGYSACWMGPAFYTPGSAVRALRLTQLATGWKSYLLYQADGTVEGYSARYVDPETRQPPRELYFLSFIADAAGRTLATVQYAKPFPDCPEGDGGPGTHLGVPYISSVTAGSGQRLKFHYTHAKGLFDVAAGGGVYENLCVLSHVEAFAPGAATGTEVARFTYEPLADGVTLKAGRLVAVDGAVASESYQYTSGSEAGQEFETFERLRGGARASWFRGQNYFLPDGTIGTKLEAQGRGQDVELDAKRIETPGVALTREVRKPVANNGSFEGGSPGYVKTISTRSGIETLELGPYVAAEQDSCSPVFPNACSPGVKVPLVVEGDAATLEVAHLGGQRDKRGNWTMTPMRLVFPASGIASVLPAREQKATFWGVEASEVSALVPLRAEQDSYASALESETYQWRYSPEGVQQPDVVRRASVVDGSMAETRYRYEGGRLAAVFEVGMTKKLSDDLTPVRKVRATFFKTQRGCKETQAGADPLKRTVRIEGPCFVNSTSATGCDTADAVVELVYYPGDASEPRAENRGRLKEAWQFPLGSASCEAEGLVTSYGMYTAAGDPGIVTDPNGVTQTLGWGGGGARAREMTARSISTASGTKTWGYRWENHKLVSVTFPEGNQELFCYRSDTAAPNCSGGPWDEKLQWQAKCDGSASTCPEVIEYSWRPDDTLEAKSYVAGGQVRRRELFASDAHKRLAGERAGVPGVTTWRAYDGADNLAAIGPAANLAPDFCGSPGSPSRLCTWLSYDRADRLVEVDFHADAVSDTSKTILDHDTNGNVRRVVAGCDGAAVRPADHSDGPKADCNKAWVDYEWDDFGNIIRVHFPWTGKTDGTRGTSRFEYGPLGNLIAKSNEELRAAEPPRYLAYKHDAMGRLVEVWRARGAGPASSVSQGAPGLVNPKPRQSSLQTGHLLLYRLTWDTQSFGLASGCPVLSNARGRVAVREDSFGRTGYVYDEEGRVLQEVRVRAGFNDCGGGGNSLDDKNPHTFYSYTRNGDLSSIGYPHGRVVGYSHDYADGSGRVRSVSTTYFGDGPGVPPLLQIIGGISWEPYGGLRSYSVTPAGKWVDYVAAGPVENAPQGVLDSCAALQAGVGGAPDGSGRLRAVLVSTPPFAAQFPPGDVMKQVYRWRGDAVAEQWTCYRNSGSPRATVFQSDLMQRLTGAALTAEDTSESFSFAGAEGRRGNRTALSTASAGATCQQDYVSRAAVPGGLEFQQDLLHAVQWGAPNNGSACNQESPATGRYVFGWDRDGRRTSVSDGTGAYRVTTGYEQSRMGAGLESVIHTATVAGGSYAGGNYTYFYDAFGRRRAKSLPWWPEGDEFFHDLGHQLLTDRGVNTIGGTPTEYPEVDYIWLGGRPVAAIQGKFTVDAAARTMTRRSDISASCARNGEAQPCGVKFIVTDYLGKPVLVLDGAGQIAATASYSAFGHANRRPFFFGSKHYEAAPRNPSGCAPVSLNCQEVAEQVASFSAGLPAPTGWDANVRVLLHRSLGMPAGPGNLAYFTLNGAFQNMGDFAHRWSAFASSTSGAYTLEYKGNEVSYGLDTEAVEVRIKESSAQWWFPRLRFPGQYFDEETELHSNGARFMDPGTGTFTGPEPLHEVPGFTTLMAMYGHSAPVYAFTLNNPVNYSDPDGNLPLAIVLGGAAFSDAVLGTSIVAGLGLAGWCIGTQCLGDLSFSSADVPETEIEEVDKHIQKIDEADARCASGLPPSPEDPNKDPREKHRRDLKGWIKKFERILKRLNNKTKREIVESAIRRAQARIDRPSPPAPPRP